MSTINNMEERIFWVIIEDAFAQAPNNSELQATIIKQHLYTFDLEALLDFQLIATELIEDVQQAEVLEVILDILYIHSEDVFKLFKGWLISHGERAYQTALHQPASIYALHEAFQSSNQTTQLPAFDIEEVVEEVITERWGHDSKLLKEKLEMLLQKKGMEWLEGNGPDCMAHYGYALNIIIPRLVKDYLPKAS